MPITEEIVAKIAREIAIDLFRVDQILASVGVTDKEWKVIREMPEFDRLVHSYREEWLSAKNTEERVRVKTAVIIEQALPELDRRLHLPGEPLSAKVELLKTLGKLAGQGFSQAPNAGEGKAQVTISISIGKPTPITLHGTVDTPKVIDVTPEKPTEEG